MSKLVLFRFITHTKHNIIRSDMIALIKNSNIHVDHKYFIFLMILYMFFFRYEKSNIKLKNMTMMGK